MLVRFLDRHADRQRIGDVPQSFGARISELIGDRVRIDGLQIEPIDTGLQSTQRLLQRFLERAADRHHLANRFHLRRQTIVGLLELFEREARHFGDDVIDRRLERRGRLPSGDVVLQFVQRVADRQLRGDLGDREASGLGGQGRAARHSRVHLNHEQFAGLRIDRELDVGATRIHPDLPNDPHRGVPHDLILFIRQGHRRGDGDTVAGVDAHRIKVLNRTDDHHIVLQIPHHLELELLPADDGPLDQDFPHRAHSQPPVHEALELLAVVGDVAACSTQGEGRTDDDGKPDSLYHFHRLVPAPCRAASRGLEPDSMHGLLEGLAVLGLVDRLGGGSDQLDVIFGERPPLGQPHRDVQRGLPAHRRQQRIRVLPLDHLLHDLERDGLDIGPIRQFRISHDRGRIAVNQDNPIPLFLQSPAGLCARVIKLAGLPDDDRA